MTKFWEEYRYKMLEYLYNIYAYLYINWCHNVGCEKQTEIWRDKRAIL